VSVVGLHPEELLDKHARGALSEVESVRLEVHAATCATCRFELRVRRDFADEGFEPPRFTLTPAPPNAVGPLSSIRSLRPRRRGLRRRVGLVALAAALVGGASFAAYVGTARLVALSERATVATHRTPVAAKARVTAPASVPATPPPAAENDAPRAPNSEAPAVAFTALPVAESDGPRAARLPARTIESTVHPTASAALLFHEANVARQTGDTERAIHLYRRIEGEFPRSQEARVSYATLGSLLLDRGDARSALGTFDAYLSKGYVALGEEALVGRALALGKLGAADGEAAAWREVLARFPKSVHARLARARLSALGAP